MRLRAMIRIFIAARGVPQKEIAAQIGISESTLSRFLSDGEKLPDAGNFAKILSWCMAG